MGGESAMKNPVRHNSFNWSFITLLLILLQPIPATGAVWHVNGATGNDANPGTVSAPLASIGAAVIGLAQDGDIIRVAEGTYQEEVVIDGFDGLTISGGWSVNFLAQSPHNHPTVIIDPDPSANTIAFSFLSSINCVLEGFTTQGFQWGVYSLNERIDIVRSEIVAVNVANNRILSPRHYGIYFRSSYMVIEGNEVIGSGDSAIAGHGDYAITHADIVGNYVEGAKIYGLYLIGYNRWNIYNNFIIGNGSAGLNLNLGSMNVLNNTILYNAGPGIRSGYYPIVYAHNNIVAFNNDYGLRRDNGWPISGYNLVFGNNPADYNPDTETKTGWPPAPTDIQQDPVLDPSTYTLTSDSPAINAGLDLTTYPRGYPVTDYFGTPRSLLAGGDGFYDIGAHEYIPYTIFQTFNVSHAKVKEKKGAYNISLKGDFILGEDSNGIDIIYEDVTVTIGDFVEIIPAGAMQWDAEAQNYQYIGASGEITKFVLTLNGKFNCDVSSVNPDIADFSAPVYVALQIGDDLGETNIIFDVK